MKKQAEATAEPLGSSKGTMLLKVKKSKTGMKTQVDASGFELIQIAAMLVDEVAVQSNVPHEEVLGAVAEFIYDVIDKEETNG